MARRSGQNVGGRPPGGLIPEELLAQKQLADELQVSLRTLERWRQEGTGPACIQLGRSPRYRRFDIDPGCNSDGAPKASKDAALTQPWFAAEDWEPRLGA